MRKLLILTIILFCGFGPLTQAQQKVENTTYALLLKSLLSHNVEEITVDEAAKLEDALFLDSREKNEFEVSHIEGAQWIGYDHFDPDSVEDLDKDQEIVVYCSIGYRSEKITEQLIELGFTDVKNMYGGVFEWVNRGKEVVSETEEKTEKVHAYDKMWGMWLRIDKENKVY